MTFGSLVMQYTDDKFRSDDERGANAIVQSIEKRWALCDQEVFICGLLFNPIYRTTPFANLRDRLNLGALRGLFGRLYIRFFGSQNSATMNLLSTECADYFNGAGTFSFLKSEVELELEQAQNEVSLRNSSKCIKILIESLLSEAAAKSNQALTIFRNAWPRRDS